MHYFFLFYILFSYQFSIGQRDDQRRIYKDDVNFGRITFSENADFYKVSFLKYAYFYKAIFLNNANFNDAIFLNKNNFDETTFSQDANFIAAEFSQNANFYKTTFLKNADFSWTKFHETPSFTEATFSQDANFYSTVFSQDVYFHKTIFLGDVNFSKANFKGRPILDGCRFRESLRLDDAVFEKGIDLRRAKLDKVKRIHLYGLRFPEGMLQLYWYQFKGIEHFWPWQDDSLRITLHSPPKSLLDNNNYKLVAEDSLNNGSIKKLNTEHYEQIEEVYELLHDNFLKQGDTESADDVMYELQWQYDEIKGGFWWKMYNLFFGWGYKPWRFLLFLVLPLIFLFALIWSHYYYLVLYSLIFKDTMDNADEAIIKGISKQNKKGLQKFWHSILFSSSVFLGIRFKKEWIIKHNNFLVWVTIQWVLGISLYITFAVLVKGSKFGFIKELLGF